MVFKLLVERRELMTIENVAFQVLLTSDEPLTQTPDGQLKQVNYYLVIHTTHKLTFFFFSCQTKM